MKKFVLSLILSVSLIGSAFCENIFSHRFFEVKLDVPVTVSNNVIGITDVFKKTVVIDLPQIADNLKLSGGANIRADAAPSLSINLDIPNGLIFGVNVGAEADVSLGLSKELFDFIGHGNENMQKEFKQSTNNTYVDVFANAAVTGGWNTKKQRTVVTGTVFAPLAHLDAGNTYIRVYNNADTNEAGVEANLDARVYSAAQYNDQFTDYFSFLSEGAQGAGFDLSADVQRDLFRFLTVGAKARIPIVPGRLSYCSSIQEKYEYSINFEDYLNDDSEGDGSQSSGSGEASGTSGEEGFETPQLGEFTKLDKPYEIHRPLKLGVSANFHPFGTLLTTSGYLGIGVRHPFAKDSSETDFYVDYAVAGKLSLWNILNFEISHSYYDQLFKNEFALALNIRLVEVDAGISMTSASFAKSFTGAGIGAFVTVAVGF